jgi:hypothetical protein
MNYFLNQTLNKTYSLDLDQRLWKYMSFTKFMSLLESRSLYFCKADKFEDVFEGKIPSRFFDGWIKEHQDTYKGIHDELKERTFINCWSLNDQESYAMWKIYASRNDGVCIRTTIDRLHRAFMDNYDRPHILKVKYIDFKRDKISLEKRNVYDFYTYKSKVYEYENEVRAIFVMNEEVECKVLPVDLNMLIENIYVHPAASEWFVNLINNIFNTYNIDKKVLHSSIKIQN